MLHLLSVLALVSAHNFGEIDARSSWAQPMNPNAWESNGWTGSALGNRRVYYEEGRVAATENADATDPIGNDFGAADDQVSFEFKGQRVFADTPLARDDADRTRDDGADDGNNGDDVDFDDEIDLARSDDGWGSLNAAWGWAKNWGNNFADGFRRAWGYDDGDDGRDDGGDDGADDSDDNGDDGGDDSDDSKDDNSDDNSDDSSDDGGDDRGDDRDDNGDDGGDDGSDDNNTDDNSNRDDGDDNGNDNGGNDSDDNDVDDNGNDRDDWRTDDNNDEAMNDNNDVYQMSLRGPRAPRGDDNDGHPPHGDADPADDAADDADTYADEEVVPTPDGADTPHVHVVNEYYYKANTGEDDTGLGADEANRAAELETRQALLDQHAAGELTHDELEIALDAADNEREGFVDERGTTNDDRVRYQVGEEGFKQMMADFDAEKLKRAVEKALREIVMPVHNEDNHAHYEEVPHSHPHHHHVVGRMF